MLSGDKNLKDINSPLPNLPLTKGEEQGGGLSYTKTNKLITALYMVTDMVDKEEPIRLKLRTLGVEILSDTSTTSKRHFDIEKIDQVLSFLDIASAVSVISEMNTNILRKEFLELKASIREYKDIKPTWLAEFFENSSPDSDSYPTLPVRQAGSPLIRGRSKEGVFPLSRERENSKGHTRIGVQKGSTLMKALSDTKLSPQNIDSFNILKKQRRDEITNFIRKSGRSATITDIKNGIQGLLTSYSEKTLQRELVSMVKDSVLNKTGEKRWSRYFLK